MKRLGAIAIVAVIGAALAHFGIFFFLGIETPEPREPLDQRFQVLFMGEGLSEVDPLLSERGTLLDSSPLFMPTEWNMASDMSDVASLQEATEVFSPFPAILTLDDSRPATPWVDVSKAALIREIIPQGPSFALARYGLYPQELPEGPASSALATATLMSAGDSQMPSGRTLPDSLQEAAPQAFWDPVTFFLQISEGRPVGQALVVQSSGFADWDEALHRYVGSLPFYRVLEDGYYKIDVYP